MKKITLGICLLCASAAWGFSPKTGDLLFQIGKGSRFEQAVAAATSGKNNLPFTHVGIALSGPQGVWVLEASTQDGVHLTPLEDFLAEAAQWNGKPAVEVFRLKKKYRSFIPAALKRAEGLVGKPYDFLFLPDNDAYYCSELVQVSFLDAEGNFLFPSVAMSFTDNETGKISSLWMAYFAERGASVPQGVPGTNPGDLSKSALLKRIHRYFR